MRAAIWLGIVALLALAHRYDRFGLLDALPALIAALVGWLFARTLRRGRRPLIARAIAAVDGPALLGDPHVARYARALTAIWAARSARMRAWRKKSPRGIRRRFSWRSAR